MIHTPHSIECERTMSAYIHSQVQRKEWKIQLPNECQNACTFWN